MAPNDMISKKEIYEKKSCYVFWGRNKTKVEVL